jgi:hypothetical protein
LPPKADIHQSGFHVRAKCQYRTLAYALSHARRRLDIRFSHGCAGYWARNLGSGCGIGTVPIHSFPKEKAHEGPWSLIGLRSSGKRAVDTGLAEFCPTNDLG